MINVLLVEDDENHQQLMGRAFDAHPDEFSVTLAKNLREAKSQITDSEPDLIIVDFLLPDGKGVELLPNGSGDLLSRSTSNQPR